MRIAYLTAGAAGMYCGSCLHDNTLAAALLERGEEVLLVPTYTPLRTDEPSVAGRRVFVGGVNAYLQQVFPLFRKTPRWFDRLLDNATFLQFATNGAGSVDPIKLGPLTVSMLQGEAGNQRKAIQQLADWLAQEVQPDVVHLPNSMLLGMARTIRQRCDKPIVCSLSGEDLFIEGLLPVHREQVRELLRERAAEIEAFTTMNHAYADFMAEYLAVDRSKIHVIPHGMSLEGVGDESREMKDEETTLVVGYFARICHAKGLHLLLEACELLAERQPDLPFELRAAGYLGGGDREYLLDLHRRADRGALAGRFSYQGELDRPAKLDFLGSLDVFSMPTVHPEAKGLSAIEAMAVGTPVVLPRHGAFPELIADTGGGVLHEALDTESLSYELENLLDDGEACHQLGEAGASAVRDRYRADQMAEKTMALYDKVIARYP